MKKLSKTDLFVKLAEPDDLGFSRKVAATEFVGEYASLKLGNGGSWCRDNSSLGKKYVIDRLKLDKGNTISHVQLNGFTKRFDKHTISKRVRGHYKGQKCCVLATSSTIQIDHKDGRYDNDRVNNNKDQLVADFQPLSTAANTAKRTHCKRCRDSGVKFDAKTLGYLTSQWIGNEKYTGNCTGCYWYDPKEFNKQVSLMFKKRY